MIAQADTAPGRRRIVAIVNPVSGRRNMLPVVPKLSEALTTLGGHLEWSVTAGIGHATELAASLPDDTHAVLAVGGDGTVCEVINGLGGRPVPLAILGTGTENLLARELRMPRRISQLAATLLNGETFAYDVGLMNQRRFLAVAGIGFDAECVRRLATARRGHITHWNYFWPILHTFWNHEFPTLDVATDGQPAFHGQAFALVGVIPRYPAWLRLLAEARYDDGLLDVCILPCDSRRQLLAHTVRAFGRAHVDRGGVIYRQCRSATVTSPEQVPIQLDGDDGGELPASFEILPASVTFLRPPRKG